ncbi:hypothetical protein K1719_044074 [Acacia pycnantha]|nr:hypothetical protein K1719_044074 [Acacia pycnantha]
METLAVVASDDIIYFKIDKLLLGDHVNNLVSVEAELSLLEVHWTTTPSPQHTALLEVTPFLNDLLQQYLVCWKGSASDTEIGEQERDTP